jgi:uncharacterized protein
LLSKTSALDNEEWPKHGGSDPHEYTWEFCFNGNQYFVFCATPAHKHRASRYFPFFMLAITPRWALSRFIRHKKKPKRLGKQFVQEFIIMMTYRNIRN